MVGGFYLLNRDLTPKHGVHTRHSTMAVADPPAVDAGNVAKSDDNSPAIQPTVNTNTAAPADDQDVNPPDFQGEVLTDNELPSEETIHRIEDYIVLDRHGKTHTFKSLYTGRNVARRVLIIFVRHFFCGVSSGSPFRARGCANVEAIGPNSH